jgi:hypothetical protein
VFFSVNAMAAPKAASKDQPVAAKQQQFKPKVVKVDRNYDGVAERTEFYDDQGVIQRVEVDTDADGKTDEWVSYEKGVAVKGEKDLNKDGKPDTAMIYDVKGVIIRTETDANGDGKIDEWVYYADGVPVKAEKDTNNDGKVDTWLNY